MIEVTWRLQMKLAEKQAESFTCVSREVQTSAMMSSSSKSKGIVSKS